MAEFNTEADAENFLIGAVMGEEQSLQHTDISQSEDVDREDELENDEQRAEGEQEDQPKEAAKAEPEKAVAPEEDEIEIPGEDGQEPTRVKVADVLRKAQEFDRIEAQKTEIVERVQREAVEAATQRLTHIEQAGRQTAYMVQAALQMLRPPQEPNPQDPRYDNDFDGKMWRTDQYNFQQAQRQHQAAQGLSDELMQRAKFAEAQAKDVREGRELESLKRAWPEFAQEATLNKFVEDMGKAYGFSAQELDDVLVDHRQALVARDALAFRAMKAQSGDVKAKVEAKAPKLVRSKQEAKASSPQRTRDASGQFVSGALADLKKTNSDEAATRLFAGLIKAGRI
jgi:hypothetical protein